MLNLLVSGLFAGAHVTARCPMGAAGGLSAPGGLAQAAPDNTATTRDLLWANRGPLDPDDALPKPALPPLSAETYAAIQADIVAFLADSRPEWPADFGTYRGLMIRLAWHCSGTYRQSDGRGGCDGARIRFAPEFQWEDNTQLDKALGLLQPLYDKHKEAISWGDLIVLTGNVAISSGGGPILGFCGGRQDDADGTASLPLGPNTVQESLSPCAVNGLCEDPLGASTVGLIYVNPAGPINAPGDPAASAKDIRNIFGNMGFNDRESVALIGGGHAFGKVHGACEDGPGPGPIESPSAPYPGLCEVFPEDPRGAGRNTFTSGFEGAWTTTPTEWSNSYFKNLLVYDWRIGESPAGEPQFFPFNKTTGDPGPDIIMLVSDIAFINDPEYLKLVEEYAADRESLDRDFAAVWYRLTSQDMGPVTRCHGPDVPQPQPFQNPLPEVPEEEMVGQDFVLVTKEIVGALGREEDAALVANLAYNCASTFRATNYAGGCNGGRIRFPPQIDWPSNKGASEALALLQPVFDAFDGKVSFADIIVLAGGVALKQAGGPNVPFCSGRVDATDGESAQDLSPRTYYLDPLTAALDTARVLGLSASQYVALAARPTATSPTLSNSIFKTLVENKWEPVLEGDAIAVDPLEGEYRAVGDAGVVVPVAQWVLLRDEELRFHVREFAKSEEALAEAFASAWEYLMNADRFDGPVGNVCA